MTENQTRAFARLRAIDWAATGKGAYDEQTFKLFFEYAATAKGICERHGLEGSFYRKLSGLFDFVPKLVGDSVSVPEEVEQWCLQTLLEDYRWRIGGYVALAAFGFVLWEVISPEAQERITGQPSSPNPYNDLITFFERGGAFTCEHNMFDRVLPEPPDPETAFRLSITDVHQQ